MPFKQGEKKKGGRKPGSVNKTTERAKAIVSFLMEKYDDKRVEAMLSGLKPKEEADLIVRLLDFSIPKYARVENTSKLQPNVTINFLAASPERIAEQNPIDITEHEEI